MTELIPPYGGDLVDLRVSSEEVLELSARVEDLYSIQLSERQMYDLELLAIGAFSPIDAFMNQADYQAVLDTLRLADGRVFPIPITLSTNAANALTIGQTIVLRDPRNDVVALMEIAEIFEWDKREFAQKVLGTLDSRHPLVSEIDRWGSFNIAGKLRVLKLPARVDFRHLRLEPKCTRERLSRMAPDAVVAFQTRNPLHRAHEAAVKRAMEETGGVLLLHPAVGMTKAGDVSYYTRVRTYEAMVGKYLPSGRVLLSLLPLAMRMAGPREAVWHALIRRNYGADHFIVGRDHASPGVDSKGNSFYSPTAAQKLAEEYAGELGVNILKYDEFVYLPGTKAYKEVSQVTPGQETLSLSGTQVRDEYLKKGKPLPQWFARDEVAKILSETSPVRHMQGVCIWFTGLSGAGKSSTAEILSTLIQEKGRRITLLDGDIVRTNLSKGLGFTAEDRDTNVRRIGFVAREIVKHGGVVICAAISPRSSTRDDIRNSIGDEQFVEIHVDTPIEVCENRDPKGMYAQARKGILKDFTGVDSPYEPPSNPEIRLETVTQTAVDNARQIIDYLIVKGFIKKTG